MKNITQNSAFSCIYKSLLLMLGGFLLYHSHLNQNYPALAWVGLVPFLLFLDRFDSLKNFWLFAFVFIATWIGIVFKIISEPIPGIFAIFYGVPIALIHLPAFFYFRKFSSHSIRWIGFPVLFTLLEFAQYTFTPIASWGAAAYTQIGWNEVLQIVALGGMPLLSFCIYLINTLIWKSVKNRSFAKRIVT